MIPLRFVSSSTRASLLHRWYCSFGTIKPFNLPDLGEKIKEATVKKIYVKEGDIVEEFQTIADVATDKLFTQIPSSHSGKIHKIYHKEEETCLVGEVFIEIEVDEDPSTPPAKPKTAKKEPETQKSSTPASPEPKPTKQAHTATAGSPVCPIKAAILANNEATFASPASRAIARTLQIDLSQIAHPTGKNGIITKTDVLNFIQNGPTAAGSTKHKLVNEKTQVKMTTSEKEQQQRATLSSKVPHLFLSEEYDVTAIHELRKRLDNPHLSFSSIMLKAFSLALRDYPLLNSHYSPANAYQYTLVDSHSISIAINSAKAGLAMPNIKKVEKLSILEIQEEIKRLTANHEVGQLKPADLQDASISFVNTGINGGIFMDPLIQTPQTTVVGLGRIITLPRMVDSVLQPRKIMNVSFGCDHRVIDGATVTRFSNRWKAYLEDPTTMLLHLK